MRFFAHSFRMKLLLLCCVLAGMPAPSAAAEKKSRSILILPFTIHAEKDLSFLQQGIQDMLATRLSQPGKTTIIDKDTARTMFDQIAPPMTQEKALAFARQVSADFVLYGSLTVFGDSISTDGRFLDAAEQQAAVVFNQTAAAQGEVIQHINQFADQINADVFGRKTAAFQPSTPAQPTDDRYLHPEKLWNRQTMMDVGAYAQPYAAAPHFDVRWKSRNFDSEIQGVAVGDVDKDGRNETVFVTTHTVFVYRYQDQQFVKIAEIEKESNHDHLGVDIADINANGVAEIFVTSVVRLNEKLKSSEKWGPQTLNSFVLEWDGSAFREIVSSARWLFRVVYVPRENRSVLFGQRPRMTYRTEKNRWGRIQEMAWQGGAYAPQSGLTPPGGMNVFGFTYGDVRNDGQMFYLAYNRGDYLQLLDPGGKEAWVSSEPYGGGVGYLEFPREAGVRLNSEMEMDPTYLPQRIHLHDVDGDGNNEVITVKNHDAVRVLGNTKLYKSGHVECLKWENFGLYPKWVTRKIPGYLTDTALADFDNDGLIDLIYAAVAKRSMLEQKAKSFLVVQKFQPNTGDPKGGQNTK